VGGNAPREPADLPAAKHRAGAPAGLPARRGGMQYKARPPTTWPAGRTTGGTAGTTGPWAGVPTVS